MEKQLSKNQIRRLPDYLAYLLEKRSEGVEYISTLQISEDLFLNKEQVKKDMQIISTETGIPNKGRLVETLIKDIQNLLGYSENHKAILIGCGSLGKALLNYKGFKDYNLEIVAAFDNKDELIGTKINGIRVYSIDEIRDIKRQVDASIGIICVPSSDANSVALKLVASGIEAIWNFAPIKLNINDDVIVTNMDMAQSLANLAHRLYIKKNK